MKKLLALAVFLFGFIQGMELCAVPDSCLKMISPNDGWNYLNIDSIKVDSCVDSPTYGMVYSKYGYVFEILNYPFSPKPLSKNDRKTWQDIDSQFAEQRLEFYNLEVKFGNYTIRRWERGCGDSIHLLHPSFVIDFTNYNLADSVIYYIENIDSVFVSHLNNSTGALSVESKNLNNGNNEFELFSNTELNLLFIRILNNNSPNVEINVIDINGNIVYKQNEINSDIIEIDINKYPPGVYFVKINNQIQKFIYLK